MFCDVWYIFPAFLNAFKGLFGKKEYRIVMVGLDAAGKTSILYKLKLNENIHTIPTIGLFLFYLSTHLCFLLCRFQHGRSGSAQYQVHRVGCWWAEEGPSDFLVRSFGFKVFMQIRHLWHHYFQNSHAVIYVIDSADQQRIGCANMDCGDCAKEELHYLLQRDELRSASHLHHIPIFLSRGAILLVFANKQDLQGALSASELRDRLELDRVCKERTWYIQPCCALTGDGLIHGLEWLAQELKKH